MKPKDKKSDFNYYHCGKCKSLTAKVIGVKFDSNTSDVINVSFLTDVKKDGCFQETISIETAIKNPDNYASTLMICNSCGTAVKKVSRLDAEHYLS